MNKYDVVIAGGGTAGCACAYTAAKYGLKVLLIEKTLFRRLYYFFTCYSGYENLRKCNKYRVF